MSSMERAPEPTMEEILASIRRIISDDESSAAREPAAAANHQDDEGLEAVEGEADDAIINDIARVLSGGAPPSEDEEDILDLTAELGGLEPVEEFVVLETVAEISEAAPVEELAPSEGFYPAAPAPQPQAKAAPEPQPAPEVKAPEPVPPPPPLSASDEAASALERAIAALRAGQLPTSFAEFSAQSQAPQEPAPQPEPPVFVTAPEPTPAPEPELVLSEFEAEMIAEQPAALEAIESEPQRAPAWEAEPPSFAAAVEREAEAEAPRVNGAHKAYDAVDASPRTLEDSVKDMLRPMLRQWLDDNMARVLTAALQDELTNNPARFQRD